MMDRSDIVMIPTAMYQKLVTGDTTAELLMRYLKKKLDAYAGINHHELADLCAMLGLVEDKED